MDSLSSSTVRIPNHGGSNAALISESAPLSGLSNALAAQTLSSASRNGRIIRTLARKPYTNSRLMAAEKRHHGNRKYSPVPGEEQTTMFSIPLAKVGEGKFESPVSMGSVLGGTTIGLAQLLAIRTAVATLQGAVECGVPLSVLTLTLGGLALQKDLRDILQPNAGSEGLSGASHAFGFYKLVGSDEFGAAPVPDFSPGSFELESLRRTTNADMWSELGCAVMSLVKSTNHLRTLKDPEACYKDIMEILRTREQMESSAAQALMESKVRDRVGGMAPMDDPGYRGLQAALDVYEIANAILIGTGAYQLRKAALGPATKVASAVANTVAWTKAPWSSLLDRECNGTRKERVSKLLSDAAALGVPATATAIILASAAAVQVAALTIANGGNMWRVKEGLCEQIGLNFAIPATHGFLAGAVTVSPKEDIVDQFCTTLSQEVMRVNVLCELFKEVTFVCFNKFFKLVPPQTIVKSKARIFGAIGGFLVGTAFKLVGGLR